MASSIIIKTKCLELARIVTVLGLLQLVSLVPGAFAQYYNYNSNSCDKYCFASCGDYFPGPEFSSCVDANVHCNCSRKASIKNPFAIVIIVALVIFGISIVACCCYFSHAAFSNVSPLPNRVTAAPVINSVYAPSHTVSPRHTVVTAPVLSNPSAKSDIPPEYCAPPPYNECIIGMDQQKY